MAINFEELEVGKDNIYWQCDCGLINVDFNLFCVLCKEPRYKEQRRE